MANTKTGKKATTLAQEQKPDGKTKNTTPVTRAKTKNNIDFKFKNKAM